MKWFKHFSDNYRGRSINLLFNEMGHTGVACYYILMELCAEKLERFPDKSLEHSDCLFNFSLRFVRQNLRVSLAKVELFLGICSGLGLLSFEISGENLKIEMPILLDLLEYDQKKSRQRRANVTPGKRTERAYNRVEYNRVEHRLTNDSVARKELNREIWDAYKTGYQKRYKVEPVRNASVNAKISQLAKRLGADAVGVIIFYTEHNNQFYSKHMHAIGLCLKDAEALHTQWKTGRSFEPTSQFARKKIDYDEVAALIVARGGSIE